MERALFILAVVIATAITLAITWPDTS